MRQIVLRGTPSVKFQKSNVLFIESLQDLYAYKFNLLKNLNYFCS